MAGAISLVDVKSWVLAEYWANPGRHEHDAVRVRRIAEQAELVHVGMAGKGRAHCVGMLAYQGEEALRFGCGPHRLDRAAAGAVRERGIGVAARRDVEKQPDL